MQNPFVDIHTHKHYKDGTVSILSYSIGMDTTRPAGADFSAGIHPWSAGSAVLDAALGYLEIAPVKAIGEIGLDYAKDIDRDRQMNVLRAQLEVAERRRLPVIIHCVHAYNEALFTLKDYALPAVIFHGYTGSAEQTATIVKAGYYLSFGPNSLRSTKTIESLKQTSVTRIFAETDDSGEDIEDIYHKIAQTRGIPLDELRKAIYGNYKRIFG